MSLMYFVSTRYISFQPTSGCPTGDGLFAVQTDLYLELLVERDFREKGGLIFSNGPGLAGGMGCGDIRVHPPRWYKSGASMVLSES